MEEAERVTDRLRRIRELDRADAPAGLLLDHLRELVHEAEEWARVEGGDRAGTAAREVAAGIERIDREVVAEQTA